MLINYSNEPVKKSDKSIFLAGPTPRSAEVLTWRTEAIEILKNLKYDGLVYVPEHEHDDRTFDYDNQVMWEREALMNSTTIIFWIPRELKTMPAFTTNVEFGYWLAKDKDKILYGRPEEALKNKYLDWLYNLETKKTPYTNLKELLKEAVKKTSIY